MEQTRRRTETVVVDSGTQAGIQVPVGVLRSILSWSGGIDDSRIIKLGQRKIAG
jgi:hypothetical protein